ncbi:SAF domain-containing protein [Brevibacterium samyangense]|uniref:Flagellar protein FlgA n=1 Tax=Brevibacterium samyangense TaxID=366888 RepID=A0ABN2T8B9_9MICO
MLQKSQAPEPRPADRLRMPRWRDPRLLIGIVLVVLSVVGTWVIVDRSRSEVAVWVAARPLVPGDVIGPGDLVSTEVGLPEDSSAYLAASSPVPEGSTVLVPVGPEELVPAAALGSAEHLAGRLVALEVGGAVPESVVPGARIDVWATDPRADDVDPREILSGVDVLAAERDTGGFTAGGGSRVEVFVPEDRLGPVMEAIAAEHHITVAAVLR